MDADQHNPEAKRDFWTLGEVRLLGVYRDAQGEAWLFLGRPWGHFAMLPCVGFEDCGDYIAVKMSFPYNKASRHMEPEPGSVIPEYADEWAEQHQLDWDAFGVEQGFVDPLNNPMLEGVVKMPKLPRKELRAVD